MIDVGVKYGSIWNPEAVNFYSPSSLRRWRQKCKKEPVDDFSIYRVLFLFREWCLFETFKRTIKATRKKISQYRKPLPRVSWYTVDNHFRARRKVSFTAVLWTGSFESLSKESFHSWQDTLLAYLKDPFTGVLEYHLTACLCSPFTAVLQDSLLACLKDPFTGVLEYHLRACLWSPFTAVLQDTLKSYLKDLFTAFL